MPSQVLILVKNLNAGGSISPLYTTPVKMTGFNALAVMVINGPGFLGANQLVVTVHESNDLDNWVLVGPGNFLRLNDPSINPTGRARIGPSLNSAVTGHYVRLRFEIFNPQSTAITLLRVILRLDQE